jgi:malate dehydrogenase
MAFMSASTRDLPPIRIAISGAGGLVAYHLAFRIAAGGMFGADQRVTLSLLEQPWRMPLVRALAMELGDCSFPLLHSQVVTADPSEAFSDADWIILLAGAPRASPSPSRLELMKRNGEIYVEHGRAINSTALNARIIVVAAPCNTNCMIAMDRAPNIPREHWFAMNRLDQLRAKALVAEKANVDVSRVHGVAVWGNHGDQVYVDIHHALIDDQPADKVIDDVHWVQTTLQDFVRRRSAELFSMRNASPAGTACQAILGTVRSISNPTPLMRHFTASVPSDGSYGVPSALVFGFPLRTESGKTYSIAQDYYLDEFAQEQIAINIKQLEQEAVAAQRWFS